MINSEKHRRDVNVLGNIGAANKAMFLARKPFASSLEIWLSYRIAVDVKNVSIGVHARSPTESGRGDGAAGWDGCVSCLTTIAVRRFSHWCIAARHRQKKVSAGRAFLAILGPIRWAATSVSKRETAPAL